jgi:hypothetical protein
MESCEPPAALNVLLWPVAPPKNRVGGSTVFSFVFTFQYIGETLDTPAENAGYGYDFASGVHKYLYAEDDPVDNVDLSGNEIDLQDHEVRLIGIGTTDYHSLIRITPENQARWKNDKRFSNHDEKGRVYCTIGAGPDSTAYFLIAGVNRDTDLTGPADSIPLPIPSQFSNEDKLIEKLFSLNAGYRNKLFYNPFPSLDGKYDYNSNSYISGLMNAAHLNKPPRSRPLPGWNKPVPVTYFYGFMPEVMQAGLLDTVSIGLTVYFDPDSDLGY